MLIEGSRKVNRMLLYYGKWCDVVVISIIIEGYDKNSIKHISFDEDECTGSNGGCKSVKACTGSQMQI